MTIRDISAIVLSLGEETTSRAIASVRRQTVRRSDSWVPPDLSRPCQSTFS